MLTTVTFIEERINLTAQAFIDESEAGVFAEKLSAFVDDFVSARIQERSSDLYKEVIEQIEKSNNDQTILSEDLAQRLCAFFEILSDEEVADFLEGIFEVQQIVFPDLPCVRSLYARCIVFMRARYAMVF